jgi:hypothetical protein
METDDDDDDDGVFVRDIDDSLMLLERYRYDCRLWSESATFISSRPLCNQYGHARWASTCFVVDAEDILFTARHALSLGVFCFLFSVFTGT